MYKRGETKQLSEYFSSNMFDCACNYPDCLKTLISEELVDGLQNLITRFPIIHISSGYRCDKHNTDVGGKLGSFHKKGMAADIISPFGTPEEVSTEAQKIECFNNGGIGKYSTFVHLDVRGQKSRWFGK